MNVLDDTTFLAPYTGSEGKVISSEAAEFLDNSIVFPVTMKKGVMVRITSKCIDDEEKVEYEKAIRNFYKARLMDVYHSLMRNSVLAIIMLVIGVLILSAEIVLRYRGLDSILLEVTDIAAWVFLWEAVDLLFLQRTILSYDRSKALSLFEAKIVFEEG